MLRGGITNIYFGHRHAVGKLHNTAWFYKVRWSFPSHFPSLLNTLLMPVRILLSLSFQVNRDFEWKYYQTLELDTLIITLKRKEQSTRMSMHMINRSRVMLSRCHSHRVCFCVDAGSGIGKIQEGVS